jgi:hypothetical protein
MRLGDVARPVIGAAEPIPKAEIEAIVAPVLFVTALMMAGRDPPTTHCTAPHEPRENFPPHVVGYPHNGHDP